MTIVYEDIYTNNPVESAPTKPPTHPIAVKRAI